MNDHHFLSNLRLYQTTTIPPPPIRTLTFPYTPPTRDQVLRDRVLDLLAGNQRWPRWGPAKWSWGNVRKHLGGRVKSAQFRGLIDDLLADGLIVEVREAAANGDWREPRHVLIRADRWHEARWNRVSSVTAREDVLAVWDLRRDAA